jgi:hypothetical protein
MKGTAMKRLTLLVLAAAFVIGACGGESDDDKVRSATERLVKGDPGVCQDMTTRFLREFADGRVEECEKTMRAISASKSTPEQVKFDDVHVDGDKATVTVAVRDVPVEVKLAKEEDSWKVAASEEAPPEPKFQEGLDPAETMEAYLAAIAREDAAALCGLFTDRYATKLLETKKLADPITTCVRELREFDWSAAHKSARGVEVGDATESGATATVRLSSGRVATLKKQDGRWAIDSLRKP